MTLHQLFVLYSGAAFMLAGLLVLLTWKALGPSRADLLTVGWPLRLIVFALGVAAFVRGATLIFPGRLVAVEHVSPIMPPWATICLLAAGAVTEFVTSHRLPPPVFERVSALFRAQRNRELDAVMSAEPLTFAGEPPPKPVHLSSARLRAAVLLIACVGLVLVLGIMLRAAAAEIPRG